MDALVAASAAIRTLCRSSYGPSGEEVLVFAPPDAPVITADGHAVLRARRQQDDAQSRSPFERVILDAAEGVYREAGDGTTQFVLLLHGILAYFAGHGVGSAASRVRIARALGMLRHQWDTQRLLLDGGDRVIIEEPIDLEFSTNGDVQPSTKFLKRLEDILSTALTGSLGRHAMQHLVRLVLQWMFQHPLHRDSVLSNPQSALHRHLQLCIRYAPNAVVHAHGSAFNASHVMSPNEFILRKSLIPSQLPSILGGARQSVRFVCFTGSLDPTSGSNQIVCDAPARRDSLHALHGLRSLSTQCITRLREELGVRLIVTTEKVEDYIAAACSQLRIACVQYAEREDVEALCSIAGIYPLSTVFDAVEDTRHVGVSDSGATVSRHAQTPSIHLRGIRRREFSTAPEEHVPQVAIFASSKGVFKQYYNALFKSLRVLRSVFAYSAGGPSRIQVCRGAGAAELSIAKDMRRRERLMTVDGGDPSALLASQALSTALVETVAQLRANINATGSCGESAAASSHRSTRGLLDEMSRVSLESTESTRTSSHILDMNRAISTRLGSVVIPMLVEGDPLEYGIVHPWQRMDTMIHTALQTAEMLLRVDAVVRVSRDSLRQRTGLHEAMEDGDPDT